jgi:hypothetical protein
LAIFILFFDLGLFLAIFSILKSGYNVGKLSNFANVCILAIAMRSEIKKNIDDMWVGMRLHLATRLLQRVDFLVYNTN